MTQSSTPPFLTAEWRDLALINFRVPPEVLTPWLPAGTRLDSFEGNTFVSVVGLRFLSTRIRGFRIPFYETFPEVNLRFYVVRPVPGQPDRRGVVFLRELVPKRAIAWVARAVYNEPYRHVPLSHDHLRTASQQRLTYQWKDYGRSHRFTVATPSPHPIPLAGEAEFILEHYWGYTRQRNGDTLEYEVRHPRWTVYSGRVEAWDINVRDQYGPAFEGPLSQPPHSVFIADGSPVEVLDGKRIVS